MLVFRKFSGGIEGSRGPHASLFRTVSGFQRGGFEGPRVSLLRRLGRFRGKQGGSLWVLPSGSRTCWRSTRGAFWVLPSVSANRWYSVVLKAISAGGSYFR